MIVNNACTRHPRRLTDLDEADWDRMMAVDLKGVFLCCRAAARQMLTQPLRGEERGRILNLSSQHGMIAAPADIAYGVGKAGIAYMTRQIASDYAADGIICNAVAPGKIITGRAAACSTRPSLRAPGSERPGRGLGHPDDVAGAALFLARRRGELHHRDQSRGGRGLDGCMSGVRACRMRRPDTLCRQAALWAWAALGAELAWRPLMIPAS